MHILMIGLNYKTAPVEIREKFSFQDSELPQALHQLRQMKSILECTIVSTCNRTELYVVADQLHTGRHFTKTFLADWFKLPKDEFTPFLTIRENDHAIEHLFRVATGLDSMILGETQILGQVRNSFFIAQEEQVTGSIFNHLFKQAITLAKRAHSETDIGQNAVSVSYAAVELGKKIFDDFKGKQVLILGAGKMGELTAKHLHSNGAEQVTVINRTREKAAELAKRFLGVDRPYNELTEAIVEADILISSTGATGYVVTSDMVSHALKKRKGRPLFMVDIAVPRDLDPALASHDDVYLYDIDDLQNIVQTNLEERRAEAEKIELLIEEELVEFKQWLNTLGVVPIITALRTKALTVQGETMESIERKLPNLTERERKVLRKHTKSIVNQLLRDPITRIKELANEPEREEALDLFTKIFALEEELAEQEKQEKVKRAEQEWLARKRPITCMEKQSHVMVKS
ncbi:glutamyl-tRNA reductase [Halalkalibacterium halodurans]|uniref:glutamyl-tRNA reductase n=1 Tax=Halalkalibacterium halodurans TaxID=86665 RepID=UPI002E226D3F|nr:glutamyl-tRNA reductase [Halalkalibacterium halodurans]MED4082198.1 glutamyl-tRNA reductase [Halalkalibacterium halodurans]MED4084505.1 glutamyl-tRNA reductase [Halalkalibacterium halodurans]MED4103699.1 glutamyl-tRNA reductase [Halalkalibacterium halodurans]MED4110167.1 glutamyl-tRNA reductase [Halalkalibacterium halodurans]MED4147895.1 glutamyl-tRNA reductase [Halalkalibacterium halodurans]